MITNNNNNNNNNNNETSISRNQQACFTVSRSLIQNSIWTPAEEKGNGKVKLMGQENVTLCFVTDRAMRV